MTAVDVKLTENLPPDWVPVEHRWHGLDRRQLRPALTVLAIALFLTIGMPAIDGAVDWDDPTKAGDVIDLGSGVTMTPPVGWQIVDGFRLATDGTPRTGDQTLVLTNGGAVLTAKTSSFDGDADALLKQANKLNSPTHEKFKIRGEAETVTTSSGLTGVAEGYSSVPNEGVIVAFSIPVDASDTAPTAKPIGLVITVVGDDDSMADQVDEVGAAILSVDRKAAS